MATLNKRQLEAVKYGVGPLMIIAGAGTGKTTVITERIKYLIESGLSLPSEIVALTFTEKAATEMEARIDEVLPLGTTNLLVSTFHGFCDRLLRDRGHHIGLDTSYKLMTTAESVELLKRNLYSLGLSYFAPLGNPTKFLFGLLTHFSRLQDENISPEEYLSWANSLTPEGNNLEAETLEIEKWKELSRAFEAYDKLKIRESKFDFGDLIVRSLLLFKTRPNVLSEYQKKYKFILVDEFQDTNYAQTELVSLLSGKNGNITVVGDDDQSIYKFRGASVSNMSTFREIHPQATLVTLKENYRSKQNILDSAYSLITNNNPDRLEVIEKIDKKLVANRKGMGKIEYSHTDNVYDEADFVVSRIGSFIESEKYDFKHIAILVRANNHADPFIRAFELAGIPYQFLGPGKLFFEPEITELISYLELSVDVTDNHALYRLLSSDFWKMDSYDLALLMARTRKEHLSLFELAREYSVNHPGHEKLALLFSVIDEALTSIKTDKTGKILFDYLEKTGLRREILENNTVQALKIAQNIEKFFSKIKAFEVANPDSLIYEVLDWIKLQSDVGESPQAAEVDWSQENKVNILTIHSAKGLEFPVVFVVNLVAQRFPSMNRSDQIPIPDELIREKLPQGEFHLQEERRLAYVALTRAKDELYLTASRFYGDAKREKKVSPFVEEALSGIVPTLHKKMVQEKQEALIQNPFLASESSHAPFKVETISFSDIEAFKMCPLHYKLRSIIKLSSPPNAAQSMGISTHAALKSFYDRVLEGSSPSESLLTECLKNKWINEGFESKIHGEKAFNEVQKYLETFWNKYFDIGNLPLSLEHSFIFRLQGVKVKGVIDRIDETESGIKIIDYKTGAKAMTQKEADKSLQLSIYALAATKIKHAPFGRIPSDISLSLIYLQTGEEVVTRRTNKQLLEAEEEILSWIKKVEESDFKCNGSYFCKECEYARYCKAIDSD